MDGIELMLERSQAIRAASYATNLPVQIQWSSEDRAINVIA